MVKKINYLIAVFVLLLISVVSMNDTWAVDIASGTCGEQMTWRLDIDGTFTISGVGEMTEYSTYGEVPWYIYREYIVNAVIEPGITTIAPFCFWRDSNLLSVSIPEGVTKIGNNCFLACDKLTKLNLPASLQQIEEGAFYDCTKLETVGSISNVSSIGNHTFCDCSNLKKVDISSKITVIPSFAFAYCAKLSSVGDLSNVTEIWNSAFKDCKSLQSIESLKNVIDYGDNAFYGCVALTTLGEVNANAEVGKDTFYNCTKLAQREILDPTASLYDTTSKSNWIVVNTNRMGWVNIGMVPSVPTGANKVTANLVNTLCANLSSDSEKAEVLYSWIVDNICYDRDKSNRGGLLGWEITDADKDWLLEMGGSSNFFSYNTEDLTVILKRGVCQDISLTYEAMLEIAGIPALSVRVDVDHMCVMAYLNNEWRFFDPTWDTRGVYINYEYHSASSNNNWAYFNMDIERFSQVHYLRESVAASVENTPSIWAQDEVWKAQLNGLVPGNLQSSYRNAITREEFCSLMVTLLERSTKKDINSYLESNNLTLENPFIDTDDTTIVAAYQIGIINGTSANTFDPEKSISRQEAATMLTRTAQVLGLKSGNGIQFADSGSFASWAADAISFVSGLTDPITGNKVMNGMGDGLFSPNTDYNREQAILTSVRLFNCISAQ